jgi:nitroimidazol reductase NimA-like FMN-containing flavoprotein (pyridoxamine 5'-phosphate oxidase superfamily)
MAITLSDAEVREFLQSSMTGILTTLRRDGWPVSLPLWYALDGDSIVMTTPRGSRKIGRIENDPRACFLVEAGEAWTSLRAVMLYGTCEVIAEPDQIRRMDALIDAVYPAEVRVPRDRLPRRTTDLYASKVGVRFTPQGHRISWDNRKIRLRNP